MKKAVKNIFFVSIFAVFFSGCKKDDHTISTTPEISFVSISPGTAKQFQDEIRIVVSYKDGDADIGENNADAKNLFVTDSRNGVTYKFRVQQLAPDGANVPIQGNLNIIITNTALTDNSTSQPLSYNIYLTDRAGHQSNSITTSSITVIQ